MLLIEKQRMFEVLFEILRLVSRQNKIIKGTACKDPLYGTALKGTQEWDFFGFDFEFCTISMLVMHK